MLKKSVVEAKAGKENENYSRKFDVGNWVLGKEMFRTNVGNLEFEVLLAKS